MTDRQYNIVVINPDQMRWDYMTPNGHPFINPGNLNRLAGMGINFEKAFVACPMCGPSRTSVVTGRYPSEHGVRNYGGRMHPDHPNLFQCLEEARYHRALFGKDHITVKLRSISPSQKPSGLVTAACRLGQELRPYRTEGWAFALSSQD